MTSKTPQFDGALGSVFAGLTPHTRACVTCGGTFPIEAGDIELLRVLRVPPPKECPACRQRRRMAMMANIFQFYRKASAAHPGETVVSQMDDQIPYAVYENSYWWDPDAWDAISFGREYRPTEPFDAQWHALLTETPHIAIERFQKNVINSEYTADSFDVKNCYLSSTIGMAENVCYGLCGASVEDSLDILWVHHGEQLYDVIDSDHVNGARHLLRCSECTDSAFLYDCHNCHDCFGCVNLRNKRHHFFNEPLAKDEYERRVGAIDLGSRKVLEDTQQRFDDFVKERAIHKALRMKSSSRSVGDNLGGCKDCYNVFCSVSMQYILNFYTSANVRYAEDLIGAKNSMDVTIFGPGDNCYNIVEGLFVNRAACSYFIQGCMDIEYCFECFDCKYCFGCSGLKKKKFCVLNRQYDEVAYWRLVDTIKMSMLAHGTYGEFLPLSKSFFYYHDTYAQAMRPLDTVSAKELGARWKEGDRHVDTHGLRLLTDSDVPDNIRNVKDDILESAVVCRETGKPFRIVKQELELYRRYRIPVPVVHPQQRLLNRFKKRNPYRLWKSACSRCGAAIDTTFDPARGLRVYCESCYNTEVA